MRTGVDGIHLGKYVSSAFYTISFKVKVRGKACVLNYYSMKMYRRLDVQLDTLTSALNGSCQPHALVALPLGKELPSINWTGGWVGPRASQDMVITTKSPCPCWEIKSWLSSPQPSQYTDWANLAHHFHKRIQILSCPVYGDMWYA